MIYVVVMISQQTPLLSLKMLENLTNDVIDVASVTLYCVPFRSTSIALLIGQSSSARHLYTDYSAKD